jgi:CMP-N-acetylneuraminic acid synthetase
MNIVAIIPARGGSKDIPCKNIRFLNGRPLLSYTIEAVYKAAVTDKIFVSTDSKKIAKVARDYDVQIIKRPKNICHDSASTESVLIHALKVIRKKTKCLPDAVLTLPPTSPLRSAKTISNFVSHYISIANKYDAMISLTETQADYWIRDIKGRLRRLFPDAPRRRQDRKPIYFENSAIYITKTGSLLKTNSILGNNCAGFIIDKIEGIDINDSLDWLWAEFLIKNLLNNLRNEYKI